MASTTSQEIIHNLVEFKSETSAKLSALEAKIDGINRRLDVSNGRLEHHDTALQDLRVRESQARVRLHHLEDDSQDRNVARRSVRLAMIERLLWVAGATLLALIVHQLGL